jgi:hypothetical protein
MRQRKRPSVDPGLGEHPHLGISATPFTSETVTRARYRIRGYLSTAAKHGIDQLTAVRNAILGNPWTPPARAPA